MWRCSDRRGGGLGTADDILGVVDGALLVDLWPDLVLPAAVRAAWAPLVEAVAP